MKNDKRMLNIIKNCKQVLQKSVDSNLLMLFYRVLRLGEYLFGCAFVYLQTIFQNDDKNVNHKNLNKQPKKNMLTLL